VAQSRRIFTAYIELAELDLGPHPRRANTSIDAFKNKYTLAKLRAEDMDSVAVVTRVPGVQANGNYNDANVVFIQSFSENFSLVGGINAPRRIRCYGSDGQAYKQLVKGNDDSRQDAVMQQVFGHVNQWLQSDAESRKRRLRMGTYHVVPLSQRAGVLEWCENTLPLHRWLLMGAESAHARFSPRGSWQHDVCRAKMKDAAETKRLPAHMSRPELLLRTYRQVCQHFPPVMRRFFLEHYGDASEWFKRRLGFTHSAAVCSMVGYVLGLGDRHPNNILLHSETAELIHIDLGVAFEQGKLLLAPERVPFRLTRDLVDGMGASGVEGPFRRSCEQTLRVLQEGELALLTILEVFLHDPLHSWRLSPEKATQLQEIEEALQPAVGTGALFESTTASLAAHGAPHAPATAMPAGHRLMALAADTSGRVSASEPALPRQEPHGMSNEQGEARRVLSSLRSKLQGYYEGTQLGIHGQVNSLIQVRVVAEKREKKNLKSLDALLGCLLSVRLKA
jgi:ataxia telangiectasia mutated family protein